MTLSNKEICQELAKTEKLLREAKVKLNLSDDEFLEMKKKLYKRLRGETQNFNKEREVILCQ